MNGNIDCSKYIRPMSNDVNITNEYNQNGVPVSYYILAEFFEYEKP